MKVLLLKKPIIFISLLFSSLQTPHLKGFKRKRTFKEFSSLAKDDV